MRSFSNSMATIHCTQKELTAGIAVPLDERTTIVVSPEAAIATVFGRSFDAGRTFPLPRSSKALDSVFALAQRMRPAGVVVVAHTGREESDAETVAEERAKTLAAWLKGDHQPWLDNFGDGVDEARRWGSREDRLMIRAVSSGDGSPPAASGSSEGGSDDRKDPLVKEYQAGRGGLAVDGIAGPNTRTRLIKDYFALTRSAQPAGAAPESGPEDEDEPIQLDVDIQSLGAGAHFPFQKVVEARAERDGEEKEEASKADEGGDAEKPQDDGARRDPRLDFVLFFAKSGIDPAPGSPDGPEFLEWVKAATLVREFGADGSSGSLTQLKMKLVDKTGTLPHAAREYTLAGPEQLSGVTNSEGVLEHDDVLPGDYTLTLRLKFLEDEFEVVDEYTSPAVVLPGNDSAQIRMIGAVPRVEVARLRGLLFDTNKAFLLPSAIPDLRARIRPLYEEHSPGELLVVGHTDTTGDASVNDPLSLERAKSTLAFLEDDVDVWLGFYETSLPEKRRWGRTEDLHMLGAALGLPPGKGATEDQLGEFQQEKGITEQGFGPETRRALVKTYMSLDGAELDSAEFQIEGSAHGCGENFPVDDTGELDAAPADGKEDAKDRRVELFFFDPEFGVFPKPPGDNSKRGSKEYPTWRRQAKLAQDFEIEPLPPLEGFNLSFSFDGSAFAFDSNFPTPSLVLRLHNERETLESAKAPIGIFGHTDKVGSDAFNKKLSDTRATITLALATDNLDLFDAESEAHDEWGLKEYQAMLRAVGANPGPIDGKEGELTDQAVLSFQEEYNQDVFHTRRARAHGDLEVNGELNDDTKAAIRDSYLALYALELKSSDFVEPKTSGCGEFNAEFDAPERNRRVQLVVYSEDLPKPEEFPCKEGDPSSCDLDGEGQRRCKFYRRVVSPEPERSPSDGQLLDPQWLKSGDNESFISALTTLPDGAPVEFTIHRVDRAVLEELPGSGLLGSEPDVGPPLATAKGEVSRGICFAKVTHPEGLDPYDIFSWYEPLDVELEPVDDPDEDDPDGDASIDAIDAADTFRPPIFMVRSATHWGASAPPGVRLNHIQIDNVQPAPGVALTSRGELVGFEAKEGFQEADDQVEVHAVLVVDHELEPEQTATT